jgi:hypothetical protein
MYLPSLFRKAPACSRMDRHVVGEPIYAGCVLVIELNIRSEGGISHNTCIVLSLLSQLRIRHRAHEVWTMS